MSTINIKRFSPFLIIILGVFSCGDLGEKPTISSDAQLFVLVTQVQPFTSYTLFPGVDSITSGTLNGSNAHQPMVSVSMNATAFAVLRGDTLPLGSTFPEGSIIFKQIIVNTRTILFAVIYKNSDNPLAGNGWLWAEYHTDGTVAFSVTKRGSGCVGCHSREQGLLHDFVRTFERRR